MENGSLREEKEKKKTYVGMDPMSEGGRLGGRDGVRKVGRARGEEVREGIECVYNG